LVRTDDWNTPSKEQKEIFSLRSRLESLTKTKNQEKKKVEETDKNNKEYEWMPQKCRHIL